ncbi:hypothetical protein ScPMuIL_015558 [Solemya velum]
MATSRKHPTESGWDSDDDLLRDLDEFSSVSAFPDESKIDVNDDDLDEEFLLGSDTEEVEFDTVVTKRPISPIKFDKVADKPIKTEPADSTNGTKTSRTKSSSVVQHTGPAKAVKREPPPIIFQRSETEPKQSVKSRLGKKIKVEPKTYSEVPDIELVADDVIDIADPEEELEFADISDISIDKYSSRRNDSNMDEEIPEAWPVKEEEEDTSITENFTVTAHMSPELEESDSDTENEKERGRGRFKTERSSTITVTKFNSSDRTDIPENLEISDEQQAQIDEFINPKGKPYHKFSRGRGRGYRNNQHDNKRHDKGPLIPERRYRGPRPFTQRDNFHPHQPRYGSPPPPHDMYPDSHSKKILINPHFRGPVVPEGQPPGMYGPPPGMEPMREPPHRGPSPHQAPPSHLHHPQPLLQNPRHMPPMTHSHEQPSYLMQEPHRLPYMAQPDHWHDERRGHSPPRHPIHSGQPPPLGQPPHHLPGQLSTDLGMRSRPPPPLISHPQPLMPPPPQSVHTQGPRYPGHPPGQMSLQGQLIAQRPIISQNQPRSLIQESAYMPERRREPHQIPPHRPQVHPSEQHLRSEHLQPMRNEQMPHILSEQMQHMRNEQIHNEQMQLERERQMQRDRDRQMQHDRDRQLQHERDRQMQHDRERQMQHDRERQMQLDRDRQMQQQMHLEQLQHIRNESLRPVRNDPINHMRNVPVHHGAPAGHPEPFASVKQLTAPRPEAVSSQQIRRNSLQQQPPIQRDIRQRLQFPDKSKTYGQTTTQAQFFAQKQLHKAKNRQREISNIRVLPRVTQKRLSGEYSNNRTIVPAKVPKMSEPKISEPKEPVDEETAILQKQIEQQKLARERVIRRKELNRQAQAEKRRIELAKRLKEQGKPETGGEKTPAPSQATTEQGPSKIQTITPPQEAFKKPNPARITPNSQPQLRTPTQPNQLRGPAPTRGRGGNPRGFRGQRGQLRGQAPGFNGRGYPVRGSDPRGRGGQSRGDGFRGRGQVAGMRARGGPFRGNAIGFRGRGQPNQPSGLVNRGRGAYMGQQREQFFSSGQGGNIVNMTEQNENMEQEQFNSQNNTFSQGVQRQIPQTSQAQQNIKTIKPAKKVTKKILIVRNTKGDIIRRQAVDKDITQEELIKQIGKIKTTVKTTIPMSRQVSLPQSVGGDNITRTVLSGQPSGDNRQGARTVVTRRGSAPQDVGRTVVVGGGDASQSGSCTVAITNLTSSTTRGALANLCTRVGPYKSIHLQMALKRAMVTFHRPDHAALFAAKYNRSMLDLSHISVNLVSN